MPFQIIRNDITKVKADAIVNTANPRVTVGDGVESAIYEAAGRERLLAARAAVGDLEPGQAAVTPAFDLAAKYIIHSSGPIWRGGQYGEAQILRDCYDKCLQLAADHGCGSIAFPLMATGTYGFPQELGMEIAVEAFRAFLEDHEMEIILVVFGSYAYKVSGSLYENVKSYIDDRYVKAKLEQEYTHDGAPERKDFRLRNALSGGARPQPFGSVSRRNAGVKAEEPTVQYDSLCESAEEPTQPIMAMPSMSLPKPEQPAASRKKKPSLEELLKKMYTNSFEKYLQSLINKKGLKNSQVYAAANISKQYFSKLMKGQVKPSKEKVLSLAIGLQLNLDETIDLLKVAGYALSPVSQTDVIVEYFIERKEYNVCTIDIVLFDYGLPTLSE